eukprot:EG_transcript_10994
MNVLVIGSGGREHTLCWKIAQSPLVQKVFVAPGNGGMGNVAEVVTLAVEDKPAVLAWCKAHDVGLVVVGPEAPLADGLADVLTEGGVPCFGPSKAAAELEASKSFMKRLCDKYNIPTAKYGHFKNATEAKAYLEQMALPVVVKADGLAAGKGVIIAQTKEEASAAIDDILGGAFGSAGSSLVLEDFLAGEEVSFYALSDGETALFIGAAQDHKAVGDGDTGPNTGGMGAYSPAPILTEELKKRVMEEIINPTVKGMKADGCPFKGVLFAGLMVLPDGRPMLLEYNVRFGDPETQVVLPALTSDLVPLLVATAAGTLHEQPAPEIASRAHLCVVYCAKGYPGSYAKGTEIKGIEKAEATGVIVFHAGTKKDGDKILANGGRVLGLSADAASVTEAQKRVYRAAALIEWREGFFRRDIGHRAVAREKAAAGL